MAVGIDTVRRQLASFFYDLAAVTSPGALAALRQFVPASQLMLGFDFPFMPPATIGPALTAVDEFDGWTAAERSEIYAGTALSLLPRLVFRTPA